MWPNSFCSACYRVWLSTSCWWPLLCQQERPLRTTQGWVFHLCFSTYCRFFFLCMRERESEKESKDFPQGFKHWEHVNPVRVQETNPLLGAWRSMYVLGFLLKGRFCNVSECWSLFLCCLCICSASDSAALQWRNPSFPAAVYVVDHCISQRFTVFDATQ